MRARVARYPATLPALRLALPGGPTHVTTGDFWQIDEDALLRSVLEAVTKAVDEEVYAAIRDLLTTDNPDFLLWWFSVPEEKEEPQLLLTVEGRGRPDIERAFTLKEMVDEALEASLVEGGPLVQPEDAAEDRRGLEAMRAALLREARRIEEFLARAAPDRMPPR